MSDGSGFRKKPKDSGKFVALYSMKFSYHNYTGIYTKH